MPQDDDVRTSPQQKPTACPRPRIAPAQVLSTGPGRDEHRDALDALAELDQGVDHRC